MARGVDIVEGFVGSFDLFSFTWPDNLGVGVTFVSLLPLASHRMLISLALPVLLAPVSRLLMQTLLVFLD